jgi:hypothetical protein
MDIDEREYNSVVLAALHDAGKAEVNVPEVVLPSPDNDKIFFGHPNILTLI